MDLSVPTELEELVLCTCCHLPFNDTDAAPKLFSCRHYFCLKCTTTILIKGTELYCIHCWKRTELPAPDMKPESLPTHTSILFLLKSIQACPGNGVGGLGVGGGGSGGGGSGSGGTGVKSSNGSGDSSAGSGNASTNVINSAVSATKLNRGENCLTHAMPNSLWCTKCNNIICRGCASTEEHRNHPVKSHTEAKEGMTNDIASELLNVQKSVTELQHLVFKQRDFLLKILETCTSLKTQIESELINHLPTYEVAEMRESLSKAKVCLSMLEHQTPVEAFKLASSLNIEKQRVQSKHNELLLKCKLDDLIRNCGSLFDFDLMKQAITNITSTTTGDANNFISMNGSIGHHNSILLLANYCISQLYSRHILTTKHLNGGISCGGSIGAGHANINNNNNNFHLSMHPGSTHMSTNGGGIGSNGGGVGGIGEHLMSKRLSDFGHLSKSFSLNNFGQLLDPVKGDMRCPPLINVYVPDMNGANGSVATGVGAGGMSLQMPTLLQQQQQQQQHSNNGAGGISPVVTPGSCVSVTNASQTPTLICNPNVHVYPIYYFNIEINGQPFGRVLIEVRNDVAPKMAKNFGALATGELGFGYKGCTIFQCWENESIITGDFELNNGRGGRSVFEESFFMPDDTKILAIRGSVGMRRSQKRHDNMGLVGSQFRVILREMRGFTAIFAFVVEGLELVEKISQAGDSAGKPQSNVVIVSCGKLN